MYAKLKRSISLLLFLTLFATLLCSCSKQAPYEKIYRAYMDLALQDVSQAQEKYVYFRSDNLRELAATGQWELKDYEIHQWDQLSNRLWTVTTTVLNNSRPEPYEIVNFVALIDGDYRVVLGILGLPEELKTGIDYSRYIEMDEDYLGEVPLNSPDDLPPHEKAYRQFMELALEDFLQARKDYVVFGSEEIKQISLQTKSEVYNYSIQLWEQLNDRVWVAHTYICDDIREPRVVYHFVIQTGSSYKIVLNVNELPEDLLEGFDPERFVYPDAL